MKYQEREDLVKYRLQRANETLNEARINMEQELWRVGINRLYYAVFYAVTALLTTRDVSAKTHKGVRQQFGLFGDKFDRFDLGRNLDGLADIRPPVFLIRLTRVWHR